MLQSNRIKEVLGLNRRNQEYVRPYNPPSAKRIADNKILTKKLLSAEGISTPSVYKLIKNKKQLQFLDWESLPKSFVIKPNQGTGGNGIIVFYGKKKGENSWIRPNGTTMSQKDITLHIENILEGRFSMGDRSDIAIIEERVRTDPLLKQYSYKGVPDIRIICFNGVPIMAMTRIPTKRSNGTANLHSGAICTGLDISTGITTNSMQMNTKSIFSDTYEGIEYTTDLKVNKKLSGIQIPDWDEILTIALKCQKASKLGYIGVDIALDAEKGPVVFELNARPGLGIQVANQAGLRSRLERIKGLEINSIKHGIRVAKNLFGGEVEESIETVSGRKVVSITEKILLYNKKANLQKTVKASDKEIATAFMDTGIQSSRISVSLANRLGFIDTIKYFNSLNIPKKFDTLKDAQTYIDDNETLIKNEYIKRVAKIIEDGIIKIRPVIEVKTKISGDTQDIEMIITEDLEYLVVIGRNNLKGYLIDTSKTF
ncbi:ATP-grasp domain-containing protein [Candidatus Microgenomates bacterium]|nr:ATP-grasp domain-containing protein [Candidatus Microgenomates bacterium]